LSVSHVEHINNGNGTLLENSEVEQCIGNISGIADHHCVSFLFIF